MKMHYLISAILAIFTISVASSCFPPRRFNESRGLGSNINTVLPSVLSANTGSVMVIGYAPMAIGKVARPINYK